MENPRIALFTGTFDPFTIGHADIARRVLGLFDRLVIGVAMSKAKHTEADVEARLKAIRDLFKGDNRVKVVAYSDLTVALAERENAHFIVRGVRSVKDFEYERQQADINRRLSGIETLLLFASPGMEAISSSLVRELKSFDRDVTEFLPSRGDEIPY